MPDMNNNLQEEYGKLLVSQMYDHAQRLIMDNRQLVSYVDRRRKYDGWDDDMVRAFSSIYNQIAHDPKTFQNMVSSEYAKDLQAESLPISRDMALGIKQSLNRAGAVFVRPFSSEKADEMVRDSSVYDMAGNQANAAQGINVTLGKSVRGASSSIYQAAATGPLGAYGVIAGFAATRGNEAITEAKDAGLEGLSKAGYVGRAAIIEGGIAAAFQAVGAGGFEKMFSGGGITAMGLKGILKATGISLLEELPEEIITEIADNANQALSGVDPQALSKESIYQTVKDTVLQTALAVGATGTVQGAKFNYDLAKARPVLEEVAKNYMLDFNIVQKAYIDAASSGKKGKDTAVVFGRNLEKAVLLSDNGIATWAANNPEKAVQIMNIDKPSRKDFSDAGLPEMDQADRVKLAGMLRDIVSDLNRDDSGKVNDDQADGLSDEIVDGDMGTESEEGGITELPELEEGPIRTVEPEIKTEAGQQQNGTIQSVKVADVKADPERFQYKSDTSGPEGVSERLASVETWNPQAAGITLLWQDNAGQLYVVDGHHRLALAKRLGVEDMNVHIMRESDGVTAEEAMVYGAMSNLADDKGTAVDAAKVFRNNDISLNDLKSRGVDIKSQKVQQGLAMKNLSDEVFRMVVDGKLDAHLAAPIGEYTTDPTKQKKAADIIAAGTITTAKEAEYLAKTINTSPVLTSTQMTLWGEEENTEDLYAQQAKVLALAEKKIRENKKIFGLLSKKTDKIENKGNKLNKQANEETKRLADEILYMVSKLFDKVGPVNEVLNDAAIEYAKQPTAQKLGEATDRLIDRWAEIYKDQQRGQGRQDGEIRDGVPEPTRGEETREEVNNNIEVESKAIDDVFIEDSREGGTSANASMLYYQSSTSDSNDGDVVSELRPEASPMIFSMPDMLEILKQVKSFFVKIMPKLRAGKGQALGVYHHGVGISLKADIFIGPIIKSGLVRAGDVEFVTPMVIGEILEKYPELKSTDIEIREVNEGKGKVRLTFYRKDEGFARKILAHEIGHWVDWMPDGDMARGNILGRLAKLHKYLKTTLDNVPGKDTVLSPKERARIRRKIEKQVGVKPGKDDTVALSDWKAKVRDQYQKAIDDEIRQRGLVTREQITEELKALTTWWNPFDPELNQKYTDYRYSGKELYAEAISVLLNNPAALKRKAPVFYDTFFAYLGNNPEVAQAYRSINDDIRAGVSGDRTRVRVRESFRAGDEVHLAELEKAGKLTLDKIHHSIGSMFVDSFYKLKALVKRAKKSGRLKVDPMDVIDVAKYNGSQIEDYVNQHKRYVIDFLEDNNLTAEDLGEYMLYLRAMNERKMMANPVVGDKAGAEAALNAMRAKYGPQMMEALEAARLEIVRLRNEYIMPRLEASGAFDQEFLSELRSNEYYATFEVVDYIERKHGKGAGLIIMGQLGTVKDISNPVGATLQTDINLIRAANWNKAKRSAMMFLVEEGQATEAERRWNGKGYEFVEPKESDKGLVVYSSNGQKIGYVVESSIATAFGNVYNDDYSTFVKFLRSFSTPARFFYTIGRPGFQVMNAMFRDPLRTIKNLPGTGLRPDKPYRELFRSLRSVYRDVTGKEVDTTLEEMRRKGLLISWANESGLDSQETQTERLLAKYSAENAWDAVIRNPIKRWFSKFLILGSIGEHANKRAAYVYLKSVQANFNLSDTDIEHMVRHWAGSPSFITGGNATPVTNNIFLFSNAMIQGYRSDFEAFNNDRKSWLAKTVFYNYLPKAIMTSLAAGIPAAILKNMFGADDDDPVVQYFNDLEKVYQRVSNYDMTNYQIIPIGLDMNEKAVYLRLPQDETGRILGGMFYQMIKGDPQEAISSLQNAVQYAADQTPGMNPLVQAGWHTIEYFMGKNPYDSFRERPAVPDSEWKAGGMAAHKAFGKWLWNNYGGSFLYRFQTDNPMAIKTELEDFLQLPFMGDLAGRFVKVSDYGLVEKGKLISEEIQSEKARETIETREAVKARLSGKQPTDEQQRLLASDYAKDYDESLKVRGGEQVDRMLAQAQNDKERLRIVLELFPDSHVTKKVLGEIVGRQLYNATSPKPSRKEGETKEEFEGRLIQYEQTVSSAMSLIQEAGVDQDEYITLLKNNFKKKGYGVRMYSSSGSLTTYGERVKKVKKMLDK